MRGEYLRRERSAFFGRCPKRSRCFQLGLFTPSTGRQCPTLRRLLPVFIFRSRQLHRGQKSECSFSRCLLPRIRANSEEAAWPQLSLRPPLVFFAYTVSEKPRERIVGHSCSPVFTSLFFSASVVVLLPVLRPPPPFHLCESAGVFFPVRPSVEVLAPFPGSSSRKDVAQCRGWLHQIRGGNGHFAPTVSSAETNGDLAERESVPTG